MEEEEGKLAYLSCFFSSGLAALSLLFASRLMLKTCNFFKKPERGMASKRRLLLIFFCTVAGAASLVHGQLGDSIDSKMSLRDDEVLVSAARYYQMGFFSPGDSGLLYLGIWYNDNVPDHTIVWVANRDAPLNSPTGFLNLTADGNLVIADSSGKISWSTNTSSIGNPVARLMDSGNLVLTDDSQNILYQSFDHPFNTLLPEMKLGLDLRTNFNRYLTSWKGNSDPSSGDYYYKIDPSGIPEFYILENTTRIYRSGPWNGRGFSGRPEMISTEYVKFELVSDQSEIYYSFQIFNKSRFSRLVLNESGDLQRYRWDDDSGWKLLLVPKDKPCDDYAPCGPNGVCTTNSTVCQCLLGYIVKDQNDWNSRAFTGGCVRNHTQDCDVGDGFLPLKQVKLPDTTNATSSNRNADDCRDYCLKNCSCTAYTVNDGSGCITWNGDLIDTRLFDEGGDNIYYRAPASLIASLNGNSNSDEKKKVAIIVSMVCFSALVCISLILLYMRFTRKTPGLAEVEDFPMYDFHTIKVATNNFSLHNKLGQGCFGEVYKGRLRNGQEIAAKKLSRYSLQGTDEFKNELLLISQLQHRNLVRILGCCIEGNERILIYEFMENKSLSTFIFDKTISGQLDWQKRIFIIDGIARGLLYLHQDSRLNIIHRDLKPSNILLDKEMNPKISDFGIAKIFEGDQGEQDTATRVVGTIGYMSPEYAMGGIFSVKSDVFSFGVIVLEILSGKRNNVLLHHDDPLLNLIGSAWKLLQDGRALELLDKSVGGSYSASEVVRCIQVGLLCVQEKSEDRPTMDVVCKMLGSSGPLLPQPKPPSLALAMSFIEGDWSSTNEVTLTVEGR